MPSPAKSISGKSARAPASEADAGDVAFRRNPHGYDILATRNGRFVRVGALSDRTGEIALRSGEELTAADRAAVEAKREVLKTLQAAKMEADIHALLTLSRSIEEALASRPESVSAQNLTDLHLAAKSLLGKIKKQTA